MRKTVLTALVLYAAGFVLLLSFRLYYGYSTFNSKQNEVFNNGLAFATNNDVSISSPGIKYNKASAKRIYQKENGAAVQNISIEQKFEKVANIRSETDSFDDSSKEIKDKITEFNAVIQFEQSSGLKGERNLDLTIGVVPENFDEMTEEIQKIGVLKAVNINKIDKTSEYKDLQANRKSLTETMNSLAALKNRGGKIDEYINLENQILAIKKQIQELGIQLGEYDEENELCTIQFNLRETSFISYSFLRSLKLSLDWTARLYIYLTFSFFFMTGCTAFFLYIFDKLNIMSWFREILKKLKYDK